MWLEAARQLAWARRGLLAPILFCGFFLCVRNELLRTSAASASCFAQRIATPTGSTRPGRATDALLNGFAELWHEELSSAI
jgi:hypothetical protein